MNVRSVVLACLLVLARSPVVQAEWPPDSVAAELGLSASASPGLEIRVWLGGGIVEPSDLYRVTELNGQVTVQLIAWTDIPKETAGLRTAKEAKHEAKEMRRFMTREVCQKAPSETESYFWCQVPLTRTGHWAVLLHDLLPDELWSLPERLERNCGWERVDGEIVGIDILEGERHHAIRYDNPNFCCPHVACAIANHVRHVVRTEIK